MILSKMSLDPKIKIESDDLEFSNNNSAENSLQNVDTHHEKGRLDGKKAN